MFIQAIEVKNFRNLKDARIEFPEDVTVIKGENEKGKSTLREALTAAIFYDPTIAKTPEYIKEHQSWHTPDELYQINLYFESEGVSYVLEKDFEKQKVLLKKANGDVLTHDAKEVAEKLEVAGGYKNKEVFSELSSIKKENIALLDAGKNKIRESLQEMVSGTPSISVDKLIGKFNKRHKEFTKGLDDSRNVKNVGKIKTEQDALDELQDRYQEMKENFEKKQTIKEDWIEKDKELKKSQKEKNVLERELEANKRYFSATAEIEKIDKELDKVLKDIDEYEKIDGEKQWVKQKMEGLEIPSENDKEQAASIYSNYDYHQQQIYEINGKISELQEKGKGRYIPHLWIFIGIAVALFLAGFLGFMAAGFFTSWVLLIAFLAWLFVSGLGKDAISVNKLKRELMEQEAKKTGFEGKLGKIFSQYGVHSYDEFVDIEKTEQELKSRIKNLNDKQETLLRGGSIEDLNSQKLDLQKRKGVEESKITEEQRANPPKAQRQHELEEEIEEKGSYIQNLSREVAALEAKIQEVNVTSDDLAEQEEKIEAKKQLIENLKKRVRLYEVISEALDEAQSLSFAKTKDVLEETMSSYISRITGGRYTSVKLDEKLDIELYSEEKDGYIFPDELSTGAIDQLYVVARFALINLLYTKEQDSPEGESEKYKERPVVLLDDPFGNFDEKRRENMRDILARLSHDFQIILFTCVSDYDDWGALQEL